MRETNNVTKRFLYWYRLSFGCLLCEKRKKGYRSPDGRCARYDSLEVRENIFK